MKQSAMYPIRLVANIEIQMNNLYPNPILTKGTTALDFKENIRLLLEPKNATFEVTT